MYDLGIPKRFQDSPAYQDYVQALRKAKRDPYFTPYTHVPMEAFYRLSGIDPRPAVKVPNQQTEPECNNHYAEAGESEHGEDTLVSENDSNDTLVSDSIRTQVGCGLCNAEMEGNKPFSWDDIDIPEDAYHITYQFVERKGARAFLGYAYYTAEGEKVDVRMGELCDKHSPSVEEAAPLSGPSEDEQMMARDGFADSGIEVDDDDGGASKEANHQAEIGEDGDGEEVKVGDGDEERNGGDAGDNTTDSTAARVTESDLVEAWEGRCQAWATIKPQTGKMHRRRPIRTRW